MLLRAIEGDLGETLFHESQTWKPREMHELRGEEMELRGRMGRVAQGGAEWNRLAGELGMVRRKIDHFDIDAVNNSLEVVSRDAAESTRLFDTQVTDKFNRLLQELSPPRGPD